MCLKYDLSVRELMDFFSPERHRGFSEENVRAAEERLGVRLPAAYREFLTAYGGDHPPPEPYYFDLFDWSAIGRMTSLCTLSLYGTNFTDCRLLSELPNLRSADLRFCRLEHTDALEKLSAKFLL